MTFTVSILSMDDCSDLEEVSSKLKKNQILDLDQSTLDNNWPSDEPLLRRWKVVNPSIGFDVSIIKSGTGEEHRYIFVEAYIERARRKIYDPNTQLLLNRDERVNTQKGNVLFFEYRNQVFCAVFSGSSQKINYILKDLFSISHWGLVVPSATEYSVKDDVFYWMMKRFFSQEKKLGDTPEMLLRAFTGYSGETADNTHSMTGEGERISAILGTLAFLFGNDPLKSLKIEVQFEKEKLQFEIFRNGTCHISTEYEGQYLNVKIDHEEILLTLLIYKSVLPNLLKYYESDCEKNLWTGKIRRDFITEIGQTIIGRVETSLALMED